jgi:general secretion pathway protein C
MAWNFAPSTWSDIVPRWVTHRATPGAVSVVLALTLGWQGAAVTWQLAPEAEPAQAPEPLLLSGSVDGEGASSRSSPGNKLASLELFGRAEPDAQQDSNAVDEVATDAPETQLNLTLKGLYAPGSGSGLAIISAGGEPEKVYAVGDAIKGNARIARIFADRVILQRNGRAETLRMEGAEPADTAKNRKRSGDTSNGADSRRIAERAQALRQELLNDPEKLGRMVRFEPHVDNGELIGYRIKPRQADTELLRELGLRPSDTITRVNGQRLNDPREANAVLRSLRDASRIRVTLLREGQRRTLNVPLQGAGG